MGNIASISMTKEKYRCFSRQREKPAVQFLAIRGHEPNILTRKIPVGWIVIKVLVRIKDDAVF